MAETILQVVVLGAIALDRIQKLRWTWKQILFFVRMDLRATRKILGFSISYTSKNGARCSRPGNIVQKWPKSTKLRHKSIFASKPSGSGGPIWKNSGPN